MIAIRKVPRSREVYTYRAKNDVIIPPSTPAMRGGRMSAGNSLTAFREPVGPAECDTGGASKDIFATGSLSRISSVGKRRMILLKDLRSFHLTDVRKLTSCRCPRDCSGTPALVWGFQSGSAPAISTVYPSCPIVEISNRCLSTHANCCSRERDWRYLGGNVRLLR